MFGRIDGIFSGMDTTGIIENVMKSEARKMDVYLARQAEYTQKVTSWQSINSFLLAFKTQSDVLSKSSIWDSISVTSSDDTVIAASSTGSSATGTYLLSVDQLAQNHQIASQGYSSVNDIVGEGTIEIQVGNSSPITITLEAGSNSLSALKYAINDSDAGVSAAIINDGSSNNPYRLILTSNETGAESEITFTSSLVGGEPPDFIDNYFDSPETMRWSAESTSSAVLGSSADYTGSANKVYTFTVGGSGTQTVGGGSIDINWSDGTNSGTITVDSALTEVALSGTGSDGLTLSFGAGDLVAGDTFQVQAMAPTLQQGQDAIIRLGSSGNSGSPISVTSSTNTVTGLIDGVTLNLKKTSATPVSISVQQNTSSITSTISEFVTKYNEFAEFVEDQMKFDSKTKQAGVLLGETSLVSMLSDVRLAITQKIKGLTGGLTKLSDIGIKFDIYGKLKVDNTVLNQKLSEDPEGIKKLFLASGSSDSGYITFLASGAKTVPSTSGYDVDVTQAATHGIFSTGSITNPSTENLVLNSGNNNIRIKVNGAQSGSISLTAKTYTSGAELAQEIQDKINSNNDLGGNEVEVVWVDEGVSGHFTINSTLWGSNSRVEIGLEPTSSAHAILGFDGGVSTSGVDIEGTINGETAKGVGQILTGDDENENTAGLKLKINLTSDQVVDGAEGKVFLTKGIASLLDEKINRYTDANSGILSYRTRGIEKQIDNIKDQLVRMQEQLEKKRESLYLQFLAMEEAMGKIQSQQTYLTSAIASLPSNGL